MLINRQLRIALIISFFWHFLMLSSVSIILLPRATEAKRYASIDFLGPILRSSNFLNHNQQLTKKHFIEFPLEADIHNLNHFDKNAFQALPVNKEIINSQDIIDVDAFVEERLVATSFISVPASEQQREIIFQPAFPQYTEWMQQELDGSSVMFNVFIAPDGLVQEVINVQASANPEIDAALARYVKRWRFAPAPDIPGQWQTIKLDPDFE